MQVYCCSIPGTKRHRKIFAAIGTKCRARHAFQPRTWQQALCSFGWMGYPALHKNWKPSLEV